MWILHLLPDSLILWVTNILLLVGAAATVAGFFAHRIPLVWQYQLPFKIAGVALLVLGVFFRGGYAVEMDWRERVAELEAKVAASEEKSKQANTVIKKVYIDRVKVVKKDRVVIQDRIVKEKELIDKDCRVSPEAISVLNAAAKTKTGTVTVGPMQVEEKK